ncbi:hypothetical protein GCM10007874_10670 [Labrys miyagiensis]|uniref:HTH cro/C1-type domain-containing protein n=1 Tax=Labrys miyagiensis TaxID=346912 RepID=A0ABQ6CIJ1_9HYPH|nr:helix-turn-helix transcriptional regulator [Labrys miyagiensis]GLS18051.1 hypothetical protein GCM10007874_10670 [Labrys miyagiensis]
MDVHARVGLNVQRLRRERRFSQEELAFHSGLTRGYLSAIEAGQRNATLRILDKLTQALGVDISELFVRPPGDFPIEVPKSKKINNSAP